MCYIDSHKLYHNIILYIYNYLFNEEKIYKALILYQCQYLMPLRSNNFTIVYCDLPTSFIIFNIVKKTVLSLASLTTLLQMIINKFLQFCSLQNWVNGFVFHYYIAIVMTLLHALVRVKETSYRVLPFWKHSL